MDNQTGAQSPYQAIVAPRIGRAGGARLSDTIRLFLEPCAAGMAAGQRGFADTLAQVSVTNAGARLSQWGKKAKQKHVKKFLSDQKSLRQMQRQYPARFQVKDLQNDLRAIEERVRALEQSTWQQDQAGELETGLRRLERQARRLWEADNTIETFN